MTPTWIEKILSSQKLNKPGGEAYRSFGRSFSRPQAEKLIAEAHKRGFGYREIHGKVVIYNKG